MGTKELGNLGEDLACEYLVNKGFKILGRNCVLTIGEIDIIARNKGIIHFVEVKALQGQTLQGFFPEEHVDFKKQKKLARLAEIWLQKQKIAEDAPYQIDIISVLFNGAGIPPEIDFFENVVAGD